MREFLNRVNESWALIRSTDLQNSKLAVFIHGFRGGYLSTWGKLPDMIFQSADGDPDFTEWDYLFIGYETKHINSYLDISGLICTEWLKAQGGEKPYNHLYNKLALFGHSLGTLGIRQALCAWSKQPQGMLDSIHSITLFGTPLNGSPFAMFAFGYPIADALKPKNPQLRMLKTWTDSAYTLQPWPKARIVLGEDDKVVGDQYAELIQWHGDAMPPINTTLDHSDLVKPDDWKNSKIIDCISTALR